MKKVIVVTQNGNIEFEDAVFEANLTGAIPRIAIYKINYDGMGY